jgi:dihydroorotase-like cyclic amidohydrolase
LIVDTIVGGGTIVTASNHYVADIGIENGVITQIGQNLLDDVDLTSGSREARVTLPSGRAPRVIDAASTYVIPGAMRGWSARDTPS